MVDFKEAAKITFIPGYAVYKTGTKIAEYAKENPEAVKDAAVFAAKTTIVGAPVYAGAKVIEAAKENPEKTKEIAKCAIIPGYGIYKTGQKVINFFKN